MGRILGIEEGGDVPKVADVRVVSASPPAPKSMCYDKDGFRETDDLYCFRGGSNGHVVRADAEKDKK
jgi:hypothetical protein